jgi:tRNA (guanine-N7-)-methyltransferase
LTFPVDTAIYRPTNWLDPMVLSQIFAESSQPLEVDVGCGKGAFLVWAGQTRPASNFLGIDRQLARLSRVDRKVLRAGLTNVRLIRVEASYCIGKLLPTGSVSAYHIYFPDPWPKRRHHGRRLFQPEFVTDLLRTLGKGGEVNVATDDADYFAHIDGVMSPVLQFQRLEPQELPEEATTEFERLFREAGKSVFRSRYRRCD